MMADMDKLSQSEAAAQSTQTTDTAGKAQKPKKKKRKSMFSSETLGSQRAEEELGFDLGIDDGSNTEQDQIESPQQSAPESVAQPSVAQPPTGQQADVQGPDELDDFNAFLKDLEGEGAASQGSQGDAQVANAQKQDVDSPSGQLEKYKLENECRKNGIDFNIEIQNIDQKAQEIAYQQGAMEDLLEKAQDAFTEDKITIEEYQQQEERISQQIETFQKQINLLQRLRNFKLKQSM